MARLDGEIAAFAVLWLIGGVVNDVKTFSTRQHAENHFRAILTEDWAAECEDVNEAVEYGSWSHDDFDLILTET